MGKTLTLAAIIFATALILGVTHPAAAAVSNGAQEWVRPLHETMQKLEAKHPGQVGLYIKDLSTGQEFSFNDQSPWYIASGVKIPIALEVLRQVDQGVISLETKVRLDSSDYVDGAGETNSQSPGSLLSVQYLLEQMIIHSDNTASDLLIRLAGLKQINETVQRIVRQGFGQITSLGDVRRHAFGAFHPGARQLKNADFIFLKSIHDEKEKLRKLSALLKINPSDLQVNSLDDAYAAYYAQGLNSAMLGSYATLLEKLVQGELLTPSSTDFLLKVLTRVETGQARIKAGIPTSVVFAHKTGTQHARICDFGVAWNKKQPARRRLIIAACTRGFAAPQEAETALRLIGQAVYSSGVFLP